MKIPIPPLRVSGTVLAFLALSGAFQAAHSARLVHDSLMGPVSGKMVRFSVALPDDYDPAKGPYPVVYHLHGIGGNEKGEQTTSVPQSFEAARAKGLIGPVVVVFPNGMTDSFWGDAKDGSRPVETQVLRDLMPHIESAYKVRADRGGRFMQGFSMGGFGAAKFLAKYPDRFRAGALYDGALMDWKALKQNHAAVVASMFGNDSAYAAGFIPYALIARNLAAASQVPLRMAAGALLGPNRAYRDSLKAHGAQPDYVETGCEHLLPCLLQAEGEKTAKLYGSLLADSVPPSDTVSPGSGFVVTGDPRSAGGATWTYRGTRDGVAYDLSGILFYPTTGSGPFGGVVVSHGKGGNASAYSARIARTMRDWGLVAIGANYTHAAGVPVGAPGSASEEGASQANLLRGRMALELLLGLKEVDKDRIAAHGHSMGAYLTAALVGTTAGFRAASHTAGGVAPKDGFAATSKAQAAGIAVPYQMHHGDADNTVQLSSDQRLDSILAVQGVVHELRVYPGYDHNEITLDTAMLSRVRAWYGKHGVLKSATTPALSAEGARAKWNPKYEAREGRDALGRIAPLPQAAAGSAFRFSGPGVFPVSTGRP